MAFETDQQTLQDLSLTGINGQPSVRQLFKPITLGGLVLLKDLFDRPLNDLAAIQNRIDAIRYLDHHHLSIQLDKEAADFIEHYLKQADRLATTSKYRALKTQFGNWLSPGNQHYIVLRGVHLLTRQLLDFQDVLAAKDNLPVLIKEFQQQVLALTNYIRPVLIQKYNTGQHLNAIEHEELDHLFRYKKLQEVKNFLSGMYQLDILLSATKTIHERGFSYPEFTTTDSPELILKDFFHPFITKPVANDIAFSQNQNLCFITGANMAGKSTLLKSIGICTYLAHLGFPVPAANMRTTVFNGLFTTINLSDNIVLGHSHFYREVLRIKEVAVKVGSLKNILVIFDELFRGTNVKDAYDASLAIIKAFTEVKKSVFIISTHIIEVAGELQQADNLFFRCLTTAMQNDKATYTYKLHQGVSNERLGMRIIEEEGLVDIIKAQEDV